MDCVRKQLVDSALSVRIALRTALLCCALCAVCALFPASAYASVAGLEDGTYPLNNFDSTTGMTSFDFEDSPIVLVVEGDTAYIDVTIYNADKFDAIWKGKRSEAPEDPATAPGIIEANFVEADEAYQESGMWKGNIYTDDFGVSYKALEFAIPVTADDLSVGRVYFVLRRSAWSPSNKGKWMGSNDNYFSFDTAFIPEVESAIARARRLIADLPTDTYQITAEDAGKVAEATQAYEALTPDEQAILDTEECGSSQSYGRVLEAAQWRIASFAEVDNSTALANGVYTGKATATSDMGKSTSARARTWSIEKLTVKKGKVTALITWSGSTPLGSLQLGGVSYENVGSGNTSSFEIPVDLNADMYFAVKARVASDESSAITYHFKASIDESAAKPDDQKKPDDKDDSDSGKDDKNKDDKNKDDKNKDDKKDNGDNSGNNSGDNNSGGNGSNENSNQDGSGGGNNGGSSGTVSGNTNGNAVATTASTNRVNSGTTGTTPSAQANQAETTATEKAKTTSKGGASTAKASASMSEADSTPLAATSGTASTTDPTAPYVAASVLILSLVAGALAFVYQYRRAEKGWR